VHLDASEAGAARPRTRSGSVLQLRWSGSPGCLQAICVPGRAPPLRFVRAARAGCPAAAGPLPRCRTSRAAIVPASRAMLCALAQHCSAALRPAAGPGVGWASAHATVRRSLASRRAARPTTPPLRSPRAARRRPPAFGGGLRAAKPRSGPLRGKNQPRRYAASPRRKATAKAKATATATATASAPQGGLTASPCPRIKAVARFPHYAAWVKAAPRRSRGGDKAARLDSMQWGKPYRAISPRGGSSCRLIASSPLAHIAISARRWCTSARSSHGAGTAAHASRGYSPASAGVPGSPGAWLGLGGALCFLVVVLCTGGVSVKEKVMKVYISSAQLSALLETEVSLARRLRATCGLCHHGWKPRNPSTCLNRCPACGARGEVSYTRYALPGDE